MASAQQDEDGSDSIKNKESSLRGSSVKQHKNSNDLTGQKGNNTHQVAKSGSLSNRESHTTLADKKGRVDEVLSNQDTSERSFKDDDK